jgi:brefeldin A-inhibited guanine nucleotide-exchange protein
MFPSPVLFNDKVQASGPEDVCFLVAVRRYIALVFTRNISNIIPQVFDISMDIFSKILELRVLMKKEISIIFTQILIPIIEASLPCTFYQRVSCIRSLQRAFTSQGGQVIVELYLNYDCDESLGPDENIYERFINALATLTTSNFGDVTTTSQFVFDGNGYALQDSSITTEMLKNYTKDQVKQLYNSEGDWAELKRRVNELVVNGILKPLYEFSKVDLSQQSPVKTVEEVDEVVSFENSKNKKLRLAQAIKLFTTKPVKALKILTDTKIIASKPKSLAHFLLNCPGLDKTSIGEVLGMGDDYYIEVMHCFVDMLDFTSLTFVKGLRKFLTHFRLPGEAQKIDRLMLKFAQRYLHNNPLSFSSADTAYILSYSTIMLNTDMYNPQVKNRMTIEGFVKNNSGIDNGKDLPLEMVEGIYKEIKDEEIKMTVTVKVDTVLPEARRVVRSQGPGGKFSGDLYSTIKKFNGATRDPSSLDTQFKSLSQSVFVKTGHPGHVKPMFQLVWMSFLMMTFSALQKGDNGDVIVTALEGFKYAIHICCRFEMWMEMKAFITNLTKFVELGKIMEIGEKNVEAVKMLLEVAYMEGNHFEDWAAVVKCISQLEVIQSSGMPDPDPTQYFFCLT